MASRDNKIVPDPDEFYIKDSGVRKEFSSGMVRDTADNKLDPSLVKDGPMYRRWVVHLTNGAKKYAKRNWMLAKGQEEYDRFRESAQRHFDQWFDGERDEDHAAAVFFNINGAEYVRDTQFLGDPGAVINWEVTNTITSRNKVPAPEDKLPFLLDGVTAEEAGMG